MPFSVYIDESGDAGIRRVRAESQPGASPYFVLGASVFQAESEILAKEKLAKFRDDIGKRSWQHATDLGHYEKVYFARCLKNLPVRFFSVISNKATLGDYKSTINSDSQKFYNKCAVYLLERICDYLGRQGVSEDEIKVIFEERNHDYDRMIRYVAKVRERPIYSQSKSLSILNPSFITTRRKEEVDLLDIADFVSHAVYQCSNKSKSNYGIPEPRYFTEIVSRFASDARGNVLGVGLKCIHSLEQLELDSDIQALFAHAKAPIPPRRNQGNRRQQP